MVNMAINNSNSCHVLNILNSFHLGPNGLSGETSHNRYASHIFTNRVNDGVSYL